MRTLLSHSLLALTTSLALAAGTPAHADGVPATDDVVSLFPYSGTLERDGVAISETLQMRFSLYDASSATPEVAIWYETQSVPVYRGRFTVLLGLCDQSPTSTSCPNQDADAARIADVIRNADDLLLGVELHPDQVPVPLQSRKRFLPVPYAVWTRAASDLQIARDLDVGRNARVGGTSTLTGDVTAGHNATVSNDASVGRDLTVARNLTVSGAISGRASCRSGYTLIGSGYCMSTNLKPAAGSQVAATTCASEGGYVCSVGEYYGWEWDGRGHPCVDSGTSCWAQGFCTGTEAMSVRVGNSWSCVHYLTPSRQYRCCHTR